MAVMLNYVQRLQRSFGQKVDSAAAADDDDDDADADDDADDDGHLFNGAVCKERVKGSKFLEVLR